MLQSFVISLAKKYVISAINDILDKNKENVGKICEKINYWTTKLTIMIELLKKISARCSDVKLGDAEVQQTVVEVENIIEDF